MSNRQATAHAGKKLGRYRIERELGRGGMGVVYLAIDENLGRRVALKTTSIASIGSSEQARSQRQARFIREVKALGQVSHENVVHVFDAGEADDPEMGWLFFYTMQFVDGITLAQMVHKMGALDPGVAAAVCMQVAAGLGAAHRGGIVHRDVKPANIFIDRAGRALIGDFGIAKLEGSTQITRRDQMVGTPNYLAPEQVLGEDITAATDVFALGALFYVVVTNRPMRDRVDPASLLAEAQSDIPKKKMLALKSLPDGLRKVMARALERTPSKRFADGQQLADALSDFATRIPLLAEPTGDDMRRPGAPPPVGLPDTGTSPFAPLPGGPGPTSEEVDFPDSSGGDVPDGVDVFGAGAAGVEEAAQALLKDAGIEDDPKPAKAPPPKPEGKPSALPVAKTESTVMFNLRQMEDEQGQHLNEDTADRVGPPADDDDAPLLEPKGAAPPSGLPVARAESTVMFNLRQAEEEHEKAKSEEKIISNPFGVAVPSALTDPGVQPESPTLRVEEGGDAPSPLDDQTLGFDDFEVSDRTAPQLPALDQPAPAPVPAEPVVRTVQAADVARARPRVSLQSRLSRFPPEALAAGAGVTGALLALFVLAVLKAVIGGPEADEPELPEARVTARPVDDRDSRGPSPSRAPPTTTKPTPIETPEVCQKGAKTRVDRQRSAGRLQDAQRAFDAGKLVEAREKLEDALDDDRRNQAAWELRAKMLAKTDLAMSLEAYRCVAAIDPSSRLAARARAALARFADLDKRQPPR